MSTPKVTMWLRLLSVCLAICTATSVNSPAMGRLCGRELADTLDLVCMGRGFHWDVNKRSGVSVVTRRGRRYRRSVSMRGIVEECCHNVCSVSMLERYCARPASDSLLGRLESHLRTQFRADGGATPATPPTTLPPSPPAVNNPSTPSSQLASNPRKFNSFFYLHVGGLRATRSPLI